MKITPHFRQIYAKFTVWVCDCAGTTALEYTFIAGAVGTALFASAFLFSDNFQHMQESISGYVGGVVDAEDTAKRM